MQTDRSVAGETQAMYSVAWLVLQNPTNPLVATIWFNLITCKKVAVLTGAYVNNISEKYAVPVAYILANAFYVWVVRAGLILTVEISVGFVSVFLR